MAVLMSQMTDTGGSYRKKTPSTATVNSAIGAAPAYLKDNTSNAGKVASGTSGSGGGGGSSSGYSASASAVTNPLNAYLAQMADWYGAAIGNINAAYEQAAGAYAGNLESARGQINASYDKSYKDVRRDAERALREAYINNMMNKRDLQQSMSAQGLTGGATETTMASLANRYGSNRKEIDENWNNNIADLALTRDNNLAQALQAYNSQMAQLAQARASQINQAEMAKAQMTMQLGLANLDYLNKNGGAFLGAIDGNPYVTALAGLGNFNLDSGNYITGLNSLAQNMNQYQYNPSEVANPYSAVSTQQGQTATGTNYAKYLASLQLMEEEQRKKNLGAALVPTGYGNNGYQMTVR